MVNVINTHGGSIYMEKIRLDKYIDPIYILTMYKISGSIDVSENPEWPPEINRYIMFQKKFPDGMIYIGKVYKTMSNKTGSIIYLLGDVTNNGNIANLIRQYIIDNRLDADKFDLLIESNGWQYTTKKNILKLFQKQSINSTDLGENIHKLRDMGNNEVLFDDPNSRSTLKNKYYHRSQDNPDTTVPLTEIINLENIDDFSFIEKHKKKNPEYENSGIDDNDNSPEHIESMIPDHVKEYRDQIIRSIESSEPKEIIIVDQQMIDHYVEKKEALVKESIKIREYIENILIQSEKTEVKIYDTLQFIYYDGYLHIFRKDLPIKEDITHDLMGDTPENPKLKYFNKEYGIPIRHNILKYILFQNELQEKFEVDREIMTEAELLLSQEYIIALTPEPRYQIWTVLRLIRLWYGDPILQNHIRKIKILVNQWRARTDRPFNQKNGIKFSIGCYPRYGVKSARIVIKRLMYHFVIYADAIGWKSNPPSYFKIINNLIQYSNCNQALKLYYRKMISLNGQTNKSFSRNYTTINQPNTDILKQYKPLES